MEGTIIKGKRMSKWLSDLTFELLGGFAAEDDYFIVKSAQGLQIFEVVE